MTCRYETGFGVASGEWGSSLDVTYMLIRKSNRSIIIVYLVSNGSLFRRVFLKFPNTEHSDELTQGIR